MQATPIHFMTVLEQADLLASGEITSVELTRHFLDRAAELDPPPFELPSEPRSDHDGMLATMVTIAREHALEAAEDERRFYEALVAAVRKRAAGFERTIFELQTVDWKQPSPIDSTRLRQTMRWLQSLGVRHLGYYPDDFIGGHPSFEDLRRGISLANSYGETLP